MMIRGAPTPSPWISKVKSFLYESPYTLPSDGTLFEHRPLYIDRCDTMSTDTREGSEEAQQVCDIIEIVLIPPLEEKIPPLVEKIPMGFKTYP